MGLAYDGMCMGECLIMVVAYDGMWRECLIMVVAYDDMCGGVSHHAGGI